MATISSAMPLFGLGILVVVLVAVDEHDDVGVLLDRARLAQVGEDRALVRAALDARESCDSAITGTSRSRASSFSEREMCEISWTRFSDAVVALHQLQVVDDDQRQALRLDGLQPARLRPDLHHVDAGRVVDVDRRARQPVAARATRRPQSSCRIVPRCAGSASRRAPRRTSGAASPRGALISSEKIATGSVRLDADVPRDAERQRRLAHAGPGGEDEQVRRLEAATGSRSRPLQAARHARDVACRDSASFSIRANSSTQEALDRRQALLRAALRDVERRSSRPVSTSSPAVPGRSYPSCAISMPAPIRRRMTARSWTISA